MENGGHCVHEPGFGGGIKRFFGSLFGQDWGKTWQKDYKNVEYVNLQPIAVKITDAARTQLAKNVDVFKKQAIANVEAAKTILLTQLDCIDGKLIENQQKLQNAQKDKDLRQAEFEANKAKLEWLEKFTKRLEATLIV